MPMSIHFFRTACLGVALLTAGLVVSVPAAQSQTAEEIVRLSQRSPGIGAVNMGLGGVGISGIGDHSAFVTNPAGLGWAGGMVAGDLQGTFAETDARFNPSGDITEGTASSANIGNVAYLFDAPTRRGTLVIGGAINQTNTFRRTTEFVGMNDQSTITTSFLPFSDEFSVTDAAIDFFADLPDLGFGAGAIEFFDDLFEDGEYPFLSAVVPGTNIEQSGRVVEEGSAREFNLGGAWEAAPNVMVGLSANIAWRNYRFENRFQEFDVFGENTVDDFNVLLDDGTLLEGFNDLTYDRIVETSTIGISGRAGVSAKLNPLVRLGATVETPTFISVEDDFRQFLEVGFERGGALSDEISSSFEYDYRTPWRFGVGAGLDIGNIRAHADVELVDWSQMRITNSPDRGFEDSVNRRFRDDFNAVLNTRAGVELRLAQLALRGGAAFMPDPSDLTDHDRTFLSAGIGYKVSNQFAIDLGWMQESFSDRLLPYPEDAQGPRQDDVISVDEDLIRNRISLGVRFFL